MGLLYGPLCHEMVGREEREQERNRQNAKENPLKDDTGFALHDCPRKKPGSAPRGNISEPFRDVQSNRVDSPEKDKKIAAMRFNTRQAIWLVIVLATNLALWLIPSDVLSNIARDEQTMLGRYSRTHFAWCLGVLAISLVSLYVDWSTGAVYKRRWFQVLATLIFLVPTVAVLDFLLRTQDTMHYLREDGLYHRPPNAVFHQTMIDLPKAKRTYPNLQPGYPTIECEGRTDARGYRNATTLDQCDVVALGDSFTEGSGVSDPHPWPVRFSQIAGTTMCNLGMSGYDPFHYLETLRRVGLGLKPTLVVCVIYEGNDFRSSSSDAKRRNPSLSKRFAEYVDRSPLIKIVDQSITNTFAPIGATRPVPEGEVIGWLPLEVPRGSAKFYAFEPKQLRDLLQTEEAFENDKHWHNPRQQIAEMNRLAADAGARLILVLAPTKARVLLPLVAERLDSAMVRAFAAIDYKRPMPDEADFLAELLARAESKENVIARWCASEDISFFSPVTAFREAIASGAQPYFTYDQHWTPDGHELFARKLFEFLVENDAMPDTASQPVSDASDHRP